MWVLPTYLHLYMCTMALFSQASLLGSIEQCEAIRLKQHSDNSVSSFTHQFSMPKCSRDRSDTLGSVIVSKISYICQGESYK